MTEWLRCMTQAIACPRQLGLLHMSQDAHQHGKMTEWLRCMTQAIACPSDASEYRHQNDIFTVKFQVSFDTQSLRALLLDETGLKAWRTQFIVIFTDALAFERAALRTHKSDVGQTCNFNQAPGSETTGPQPSQHQFNYP
ncbi:hypothetical protein AFLA_011108 [Aspergillus flavus NRRL3357]|nr:hypothetical protein AFLA_011108 [Aspergillus flavus NRRL3357]